MMNGRWGGGRGWIGGLVGLLAIALCTPAVADGGEPTEQIRGAIDRGLAIVRRADLQGDENKTERRALLRKELFPYFHFEEMSRRSLGIHWRNRTPQERREFVNLFTDLLENAYAGKIEGYKGEKIRFGKETLDPPYAEVQTTIVTPQGQEFSVDYRLLADGSRWRVYDIIIEGVSLVNNYRSQFAGILQKSSFEEMTRKLKETIRKQSGA
ncbi:MAG: ABC transporter substrate-binding protein [Deltaproteobacteria bacterium]